MHRIVAPLLLLPSILHAQSQPTPAEAVGNTNALANNFSLDLPAVSQINGKVGYSGGNINSESGHLFDGSISLPVSHAFGFQADGLYSRVSDMDLYGGAGHFFWRNPGRGLIGVTGGYLARDGAETFQTGLESQYYYKQFTFGAFAGVGSITYANSAPFIETNPTRFVGRLSADYYALQNLRLGVAYTTALENNLVQGSIEYQTPIRGLALTAEVAKGDFGYDHWLLGLRYYFGGNKSLVQRHRQDDPPSLMHQVLYTFGGYDAEFERKSAKFTSSSPENPENPGSGGTTPPGGGPTPPEPPR